MSREEVARLPRRNLTLYTSSETIMARLRERLEASSDSEVVRTAVKFLDRLVEDQCDGTRLEIRPVNGDPYTIMYTSLFNRDNASEAAVKRNMIMNEPAIKRLDRVKSLLGVSSDSEIVRRSLTYLSIISEQTERGSEFLIVDKDGNEKYVDMEFLFPTPQAA